MERKGERMSGAYFRSSASSSSMSLALWEWSRVMAFSISSLVNMVEVSVRREVGRGGVSGMVYNDVAYATQVLRSVIRGGGDRGRNLFQNEPEEELKRRSISFLP
ncbi:hypothetical protein O6H91_Y145500 [Diphasiastrum complanatum]|nr:hypothetical protein O6H91_Y145500 [Diphasiastrum complanatum]